MLFHRFEMVKMFFSSVPLLSNTDQPIPDPFIITKSRTLNKRVMLNVGGVRQVIFIFFNIANNCLGGDSQNFYFT